jgi:hypothetical protein
VDELHRLPLRALAVLDDPLDLLKEGLTEDERFAVADHTVAQFKERGDQWRAE